MPVTIPSREAIGVPVPSTVLADQDISIGITGGVLDKYDLKRGSEVLGLVKLPGAILSGLVAGVTQGLTDEKSIIDKRKGVAESEEALTKAIANRNTTALASRNTQATDVGETGVNLQSATVGEAQQNSYAAVTLTVYPHSETLIQLINSLPQTTTETTTETTSETTSEQAGDVGGPLVNPPQSDTPAAEPKQ